MLTRNHLFRIAKMPKPKERPGTYCAYPNGPTIKVSYRNGEIKTAVIKPTAAPERREQMSDNEPAAVENLRNNQGQADMDGVMVTVSRQALDETLDYLADLQAQVAALEGKRDTLKEANDELSQIGQLIRTQDNRCTDQPIFIVERKREDWGYDSAYTDQYKWVDVENEYCEASEEKAEKLEELDDACESTGTWEKIYYQERWEYVTACFTEQGCKDYLAANGHNITGETRIFADGSYRNREFQAVRKFLEALPPPSTAPAQYEYKAFHGSDSERTMMYESGRCLPLSPRLSHKNPAQEGDG